MSIDKIKMDIESEYEDKTKEIIILTDASFTGAYKIEEGIFNVSRGIIAYVDLEEDKVYEKNGKIEWIEIKENLTGKWGFSLKNESLYHIKVRKIKKECAKEESENNFMIIDILRENVIENSLSKILEEYKKDVFIFDEAFGEFKLNKQFNWFEGKINFDYDFVNVVIINDNENIECQFETLRELCKNKNEWEKKIKTFANEKILEYDLEYKSELENINEAQKSDIEEKMDCETIKINAIRTGLNGDFEIAYEEGYDTAVVSGNINGDIKDLYM